MNAQEALEKLCAGKGMLCDYLLLKQLIDQSNAKPKTLEELGWEQGMSFKDVKLFYEPERTFHCYVLANKMEIHIDDADTILLTYEEILAIAEKMKELGMTNEKENDKCG